MSFASEARQAGSKLFRILGSLLALALFVFLALATISGYLLYQILDPPRNPANVDVTLLMGHPTVYTFDIPGEGSREGWFFPGLLHAPTIILCHGYGSQRADILTLVTALQEHQFNVFLFDFIGHGSVPGRTTLGYQESIELLAAIQGLQQRDDIDPRRFGVWGTDLGAYAALSAATRDARIRAIAVDSAYDKPSDLLMIEVGQTGLGSLPGVKSFCLFGFRMLNHKDRMDPPLSARLASLQGTPKLFIESTDKPGLATATLRLYQDAPPPKDQFVDEMTYGEMSDEDRRTYENRIVTFFLLHLPPSGESSP
jgi:pimeloyl-ACP methyl ester carboxylesterase